MTDYDQHLEAVLENFTKTLNRNRLSRESVRGILSGLLEEFKERPNLPPQELREITEATNTHSVMLSGLTEAIWLQRLHTTLDTWDSWSSDGDTLTGVIERAEDGRKVPTLEYYGDITFYSVDEGLAVRVSRDTHRTDVTVHSPESDPDVALRYFEEWIQEPDPFEGKIVRYTSTGVSVLNLSPRELRDYDAKAEASVAWLRSLADEGVRDALSAAGLSSRAGLLLEGPPGSGKTTLARREAIALAGEATVIYGDPSVPAGDLFAMASDYTPALLVLEDVESFFGDRGMGSFSDFLNAFDGVQDVPGLMVLATTNDASRFDSAVTRPGRLERKAVIAGVQPGFTRELLEDRLRGLSTETLDSLAVEVESRADGSVTPALIDSLSRTLIMERIPEDRVVEFTKTAWEPTFAGKSYID